MQAVDRHGRDWVSVSRDVSSKTNQQCLKRVKIEVTAGRMLNPGARALTNRTRSNGNGYSKWRKDEVAALYEACSRFGRDWITVAHVMGRTTRQCFDKANFEIEAGRMPDPGKRRR
jgi:hypothetical protein